MKVKKKSWKQIINCDLKEAWHFFSLPQNLDKITPPNLSFEILTDLNGKEIYSGMIIQYQISPFLGIKMDWVTEITHVKDETYFIDEQRFGPYALWHHQHHFESVSDGVLMTDILHYKIPYGPIGGIANTLFVEKMIEGIFSHREKIVGQLFKH